MIRIFFQGVGLKEPSLAREKPVTTSCHHLRRRRQSASWRYICRTSWYVSSDDLGIQSEKSSQGNQCKGLKYRIVQVFSPYVFLLPRLFTQVSNYENSSNTFNDRSTHFNSKWSFRTCPSLHHIVLVEVPYRAKGFCSNATFHHKAQKNQMGAKWGETNFSNVGGDKCSVMTSYVLSWADNGPDRLSL